MRARLPQGMGGGMGNMNQMIKQAQKMQDEMTKVQEELAVKEYKATAGGGMVEATVNGKRQVVALNIKPEVIDPEDAEILQDMIIGAVNEAIKLAEEDNEARMSSITGGLNIPGLM